MHGLRRTPATRGEKNQHVLLEHSCPYNIYSYQIFIVEGFCLLGGPFFAGGYQTGTPTLGVVVLVVSVAPDIPLSNSPARQVQQQQQFVRFPRVFVS